MSQTGKSSRYNQLCECGHRQLLHDRAGGVAPVGRCLADDLDHCGCRKFIPEGKVAA